MPLMFRIFDRGRGSAKPWVTSSFTSSWRRAGLNDAPLWFPNVSVLSTSWILFYSSNSLRSHSEPFLRSDLKQSQLGWHDRRGLGVDCCLNSEPYPRGVCCCAFSAFLMLLLNFLMMQ